MAATRKSFQRGLRNASKENDDSVVEGGESSDFFSVDPFPLDDNSLSEITHTEEEEEVVVVAGGVGGEDIKEVPQTPKVGGGDKRKLMSKVGKALSFRMLTPRKPTITGHIGEVNQEAIREKLASAKADLLETSTPKPGPEKKKKKKAKSNPKQKLERSSSNPRLLPSSVKDISKELGGDTGIKNNDSGKTRRRSKRSSSVGKPGTRNSTNRSSAATRRRSRSRTKYPESDLKQETGDPDKSNSTGGKKEKARRPSGSNMRGRQSAARKSTRSKPEEAITDSAEGSLEQRDSVDHKSGSDAVATKEDRQSQKRQSRHQRKKVMKTTSRSLRKERSADDSAATGFAARPFKLERASSDGKLLVGGKSNNNSSRATKSGGVRASDRAKTALAAAAVVAASRSSPSRKERTSLTILDLQDGGKTTNSRPKLERSSSIKAALKSGGESLKNFVRSNTDTPRLNVTSPRKERSSFEPMVDEEEKEGASQPKEKEEEKASSGSNKRKGSPKTGGEKRLSVRNRPGLNRATSERNFNDRKTIGGITARQRLQRAASVKGLVSSKNLFNEIARETNQGTATKGCEASMWGNTDAGGPHRKQQKRASRLHRISVVTSEVAHIQLQQLENHQKKKERTQQKSSSPQISGDEEVRKEAIKMLEEKYGGGNSRTKSLTALKSRKSSTKSRLTLQNIFHGDKETSAAAPATQRGLDLPMQIQGPILAAPPGPSKDDSESSAVPSDHADLDDSIHRHAEMMMANTAPFALSA